jgi:uncharacterized membrane protein
MRKAYLDGLSIQLTMNTRKIAIIVILTALCISSNYALLPFFNVKFMDFIVLVGGFCFGPLAGGLIGVLSWGIYGTINPLGFSLPTHRHKTILWSKTPSPFFNGKLPHKPSYYVYSVRSCQAD